MTLAAVVVVSAMVTAVMTVLLYMSKEADTRESWLVEAVAVVALRAVVHYGMNLHETDV